MHDATKKTPKVANILSETFHSTLERLQDVQCKNDVHPNVNQSSTCLTGFSDFGRNARPEHLVPGVKHILRHGITVISIL